MNRIKAKNIFCLLVLFMFVNTSSFAQLRDVGGIGTFELSKGVGQFTTLSIGEELRFDQTFTSLNRSNTFIGADFTILDKILKTEVIYSLLYRRNTPDFYEFRHRIHVNVVGQYRIDRLIFKLRTRGQVVFLDGERQEVSFNPQYVWRNRLAIEYNIRKSPLKPYITAEIFTPLNGKKGFYMDAYRLTTGTKYKVSKQSSLDFMLRFDQDVQVSNPKNILYFSVGWDYEL